MSQEQNKDKKQWYKRGWFITIVSIMVLGFIGSFIEDTPVEDIVLDEVIVVPVGSEVEEELIRSKEDRLKQGLEKLGDELEEYNKRTFLLDECVSVCAGSDVGIPAVKDVCYSDCYQVYYYRGLEGLRNYTKEMKID